MNILCWLQSATLVTTMLTLRRANHLCADHQIQIRRAKLKQRVLSEGKIGTATATPAVGTISEEGDEAAVEGSDTTTGGRAEEVEDASIPQTPTEETDLVPPKRAGSPPSWKSKVCVHF